MKIPLKPKLLLTLASTFMRSHPLIGSALLIGGGAIAFFNGDLQEFLLQIKFGG